MATHRVTTENAPFADRNKNFLPFLKTFEIASKEDKMLDLTTKFLEPGETLVCFGDSITHANPGYVGVLQERLPENKIINAGVGGDKTITALMRFQRDVLDVKPDAVSIFLGTNDSLVGRGCWADEPMISAEAYRCNLVWMAHLAILNGIKKVSIATPLAEPEGNNWYEQGDMYAEYCLAARAAANEMKLRIIPLDSMFRDEWRKHPGHTGLLLTKDGVHPTDEGYRMIAETFLKAWNQ